LKVTYSAILLLFERWTMRFPFFFGSDTPAVPQVGRLLRGWVMRSNNQNRFITFDAIYAF
jgi:hypothetical protein